MNLLCYLMEGRGLRGGEGWGGGGEGEGGMTVIHILIAPQ